jgi:methionine aminotransferase
MTLELQSRLPHIGTTIFTVMSQLANEHQAINLSQGFPDFAPPAGLIERMVHHISHSNQQYAPMAGAPVLREAIAEKVERLYGRYYHPDTEVTVTAGATQALTTAITACVRPGDEVIVFAPVYDSYVPAIELNGGKVVTSNLQFPSYKPNWEEVRSLISSRTRMIILNTPHNPTGTVWSVEDMQHLSAVVKDTHIILLADEVYEHMSFDGAPHLSLARYSDLSERAFVVSSFGKTYHVTGWKIAYCVAPAELMKEFRKSHQFITFCIHHPSQLALADFMRHEPEFADALSAFYQEKRDGFRAAMKETQFELFPCAGTYFQLASYARISDEQDQDFARRMTTDHGVAVIPVSAFYPEGDDHRVVRFCFAKNQSTIDAALERLLKI